MASFVTHRIYGRFSCTLTWKTASMGRHPLARSYLPDPPPSTWQSACRSAARHSEGRTITQLRSPIRRSPHWTTTVPNPAATRESRSAVGDGTWCASAPQDRTGQSGRAPAGRLDGTSTITAPTAPSRRRTTAWLVVMSGEVLAAVYLKHVSGDPIGVGSTQPPDRSRDVPWISGAPKG